MTFFLSLWFLILKVGIIVIIHYKIINIMNGMLNIMINR